MTQVGSGTFVYEHIQDLPKLPPGTSFGKIPAVATDSQDRLYVFQRSAIPTLIFDRDGNYLSCWGSGIMTDPHGLTIVNDIAYTTDRKDSVAVKLELARAAKAANIPFTLATGSNTSLEEVAKVAGGTLWFQLYMWPGKLIIKGILTPLDAERAVARGVDGIIVSNHGGRNFDSSMAPIEVLPSIVDAVGNRTTVMVDSSFRRGSDVVKALAIGAKLVMIGRPTLWGTTVGGEAGAARAIKFYREEISRTIAYLGCRTISDLNRDCLEFVQTPHLPLTM